MLKPYVESAGGILVILGAPTINLRTRLKHAHRKNSVSDSELQLLGFPL